MSVFIHPRFDPIYQAHPLVMADVGARGGLKKNWQPARRHLRLFGFEPDAHEFARLAERARTKGHGDTYFNVALHSRRGPIQIHVARDAGLTSIFEPNREFLDAFPDASRFDTVDRRAVDADTLDHVLESHGERNLDFIKADTQGSEFNVLEGARSLLTSTVLGVEAEVNSPRSTKISRSSPTSIACCAGWDFFCSTCARAIGSATPAAPPAARYGQLIWSDALYLKSVPALQQIIAPLDPDRKKSKVLHALTIALLYGYVDYALEITHATSTLWTEDELTAIDQSLRATDDQSGALAKLPGSKHLSAALGRLRDELRDSPEGWSVSDKELGNLD